MSLDPDVVTRKTFEHSFRGYDPMEVQAYLLVVADELRAARDREFDLELRLSEADRRAREAYAEVERLSRPAPPPPPPPTLEDLEPAELARLLGDETARVLEAARRSAAEIVERAQADAEAITADAGTQVQAALEAAERDADELRELAAAEVAALRREAEADVSELRVVALDEIEAAREKSAAEREDARQALDAELQAQRAVGVERAEAERQEAEARAEAARVEAERIHAEAVEAARAVALEARAFRKQVLADLAARRHAALEQLSRLQAARDHLAEAVAAARRTLDELGDGTEHMLDHAREVADEAASAVTADGPTAVGELEAFLASRSDASAALDRIDGGDGATATADTASGEDGPVGDRPASRRRRRSDQGEPEVVTSLFARIRADAEAFSPPLPAEGAPTDEELTELVAAAEAANAVPDEAVADGDPSGEDGSADGSGPAPAEAPTPEVGDAVAAASADGQPDVASSRALALAGPERGLGRVLKRLLSDEQNELFDLVRRSRDLPSLDEVLGDTEAHALRYAGAARAELRDAAYAGAHLLGTPPAGTERPAVDDLAAQLGVTVIVPLRERLEACWRAAEAGEVDAAADAREIFREWRTAQLPPAVHQHVAHAFNRGLAGAAGRDAEPWLVEVG